MVIRFGQYKASAATAAFTLTELLVSVAIIGLMVVALLYGYVQVNRKAEWTAMSMAAQSVAAQGAEMARGALWEPKLLLQLPNTGLGTYDEMPATNGGPNYTTNIICLLDIPSSGAPVSTNGVTNLLYAATNRITIIQVMNSPSVRQIQSDCVWTFPLTGQKFTNTVLTIRAGDEQ